MLETRSQTILSFSQMVSSDYFNEIGNGTNYRRCNDLSASLNIIPHQHTSGGKDTLIGIVNTEINTLDLL